MDITITFKQNHRCFKKGEVIKIPVSRQPIVLVGDQGTGKSTILEILADALGVCPGGPSFSKTKDIVDVVLPPNIVSISHDYEKGNVRGASAFGMGGVNIATELNMLHASHGQAAALATRSLVNQLAELVKKNPGTCGMLLLDEPDGGLSIRTAKALGMALARVSSRGHYVIVSLHNPIAMKLAASVVFDVELRKNVDPAEFIDRMLE